MAPWIAALPPGRVRVRMVASRSWRDRAPPGRLVGAVIGVALRAAMFLMLRQVLKAGPRDHRFIDKGIGSRALLLVPASSITMPVLCLRGRTPYPFWMDDLFLSIVALDLGGNVFDLYDGYPHFDLIPHGHGTGALTVLLAWLFGLQAQKAALLATAGHALLEGQELASDVLFGYRNVRGWRDTAGDLASGAIGTATYAAMYAWLVRRAGLEPPSPLGIGATGSGPGRSRG